jgi:4-alpha-glucanotransferase
VDKHAGLMVPLFSAWSTASWGIGEFPDLVPLAGWSASAGFDRVMLLPFSTLPDGVTSPFSAMTAMAIDPVYIAVDRVEDFARAGGLGALPDGTRRDLDSARSSPGVRYEAVRRAKLEALGRAFQRFADDEWIALTPRAASLAAYIARERWWLDEYALYVSLARAIGESDWRDWPPPFRDREPAAIEGARRQLAREILQQQYWQWLAESQWQDARRAAREAGVTVFGDLPFMVSANGPDLWTRPGEYFFDVSLGVPPDAFSETGQDWNAPTYHWQAIAATDYAWIKARARRMAALFDGYRVDHLVGLYRTFGRPKNLAPPFFNPPTEPDQTRQGERILRILLESGAAIVAEDLGVVPDFVRASLERLGVPGSKVLRWERRWTAPGGPFIDPARYPVVSAAMTGTHDTETLAQWWGGAPADERRALAAVLSQGRHASIDPAQPWSAAVRDALLGAMYAAGSSELFLPVQDVFGWPDRINVPAIVSDDNWTWRLPWPIDRWTSVPAAVERAAWCARQQAARRARSA